MQEARLPENEARRLATLRELAILDSPREGRFDRYTRIAARAFETPTALISLVDEDRQWFKSAVGIDIEETPREISFCGHAILGDGVFEVQNARLDPRFRDNPLVVGPPRIRFYAGAPLIAPNGQRLGTLCIIDRVPHKLSDAQKLTLQRLADSVVGEMLKRADTTVAPPDREMHTITGASFFNAIPKEHGLSVLLFDIDDVLASHDDEKSGLSPGEVFAQLLHEHFPLARSIAHIGDYHYCVLLKPDEVNDELRAISRLCSDAKKLLCFAEGHESLTPFVGHLHYNPDSCASTDDMLFETERMFLSHERVPSPDAPDFNQFLKNLVCWRKTTF